MKLSYGTRPHLHSMCEGRIQRKTVKEKTMRRIVNCLIVGGLLAAGPGLGISDDRSDPNGDAPPSPYERTIEASSASQQPTYSEVFGGTTSESADPAWANEPPAPAPAQPQRRGSYTLSRSPREEPATTSPREEPATTTAPAVVHAEYEHDESVGDSGQIEQVNGTDVAPARPVDRSGLNRLAEPVATGLNANPPARPEPQPMRPSPAAPSAPPAPASTGAQPQIPAVAVEWRRAGEISIGREFVCELIVGNRGDVAARNMELTAFLPSNVRLISAEPQPSTAEGHLGWSIRELAAGEQVVYSITLLPQEPGEIATHAEVRFTGTASARFEVAQPMLAVNLDGPADVLIGEAATQVITITNPGNGIAQNVHVEALIPPGLEHVRGSRLLMDIGALHPGEVRSIRLPLAAVAGGLQTVQVQTRADQGLADVAATDITVKAPELLSSIEGPGLRYVGRRATYRLAVANEGTVASDNVQLMHKVPEGFRLVNATADVKFDENLRLVNWHIGSLRSGQAAEVQLTFDCGQIGSFTHFVRATSEHGVISDSSIQTDVEGISVLTMDIQDLEDPVEVGTETVYEIQVKNEGSAPASDVAVSCELPAGINLVDVAGPVEYVAERNLIVFRPIATLAPNAESNFKVHVSSAQTGNMRFRARLSSASIEEPLIEEELTRFYGE